jgi:hypothetical protein
LTSVVLNPARSPASIGKASGRPSIWILDQGPPLVAPYRRNTPDQSGVRTAGVVRLLRGCAVSRAGSRSAMIAERPASQATRVRSKPRAINRYSADNEQVASALERVLQLFHQQPQLEFAKLEERALGP